MTPSGKIRALGNCSARLAWNNCLKNKNIDVTLT